MENVKLSKITEIVFAGAICHFSKKKKKKKKKHVPFHDFCQLYESIYAKLHILSPYAKVDAVHNDLCLDIFTTGPSCSKRR